MFYLLVRRHITNTDQKQPTSLQLMKLTFIHLPLLQTSFPNTVGLSCVFVMLKALTGQRLKGIQNK